MLNNQAYKILPILLLLIMFECIERNNPWDPANGCPEPFRKELHDIFDRSIDSSITNIKRYAVIVKDYKNIFNNIKGHNDSIVLFNGIILHGIDSLHKLNDSIEQNNESTDSCDIKIKVFIDTLLYYDRFVDINEVENYKNKIKVDSLKIKSLISSANERCSPQGIYDSDFIDSVNNIVNSSMSEWTLLLDELDNYNKSVFDTNALVVTEFNNKIRNENDLIRSYNSSISRLIFYCNQTLISDPDTLEAIVPELLPGDTVYLGNESIGASIRFSSMGDSTKEPIVIIGSPFKNTVFDQPDFYVSASSNIEFHNLTFSNGVVAGAKLEYGSGKIRFENCEFSNNRDYGLEVIESSVTLVNCKIYHNSGTGIRVQSMEEYNHSISAENVLIAHNRAYGINTVSARLYLNKVTISDNGLGGIRLEVPNKPSVVTNSLITYNNAFGVLHESSEYGNAALDTKSTNFFGNVEAILADSAILQQNIPIMNIDPFYVSKSDDNYNVGEQSVLYGTKIGYKD